MEAMDCIITRRSIREFDTSKKIEKETIKKILRAAMYAPSAHNKKPWEFLVVEDREILNKMPEIQQWTKFVETAPMAIIVCTNKDISYKYNDEDDYGIVDCAAATQNLLLAAHAENLGACWCGVAPMKDKTKSFKELFNLPQNIDPFAIVILGQPLKEPFQPKERFSEEKIHWGKW